MASRITMNKRKLEPVRVEPDECLIVYLMARYDGLSREEARRRVGVHVDAVEGVCDEGG